MARADGRTSLFDRWSAAYDGAALQRVAYRPVHDAVLARVDDLEPETVVDLGCGTGQLSRRLLVRFPEATIVGVDLSDGMLARAADRLASSDADRYGLVQASAGWLPLTRSSVDLVVCTESFHWYPDQARALQDLADVLRSGGRLVVASIATVTDVGDRLVRSVTRAGGTQVRAVPAHRMRQLLARSGFDVIHQRRIPRLGPIGWPVLTDARRR